MVLFWHKVDIEMDGKMLNSHGVDFLDGPLGLDLDEKDLDEEETRRDMAKILKELKQKHPDKEVGGKSLMEKNRFWNFLWLLLLLFLFVGEKDASDVTFPIYLHKQWSELIV